MFGQKIGSWAKLSEHFLAKNSSRHGARVPGDKKMSNSQVAKISCFHFRSNGSNADIQEARLEEIILPVVRFSLELKYY